MFNVDQKCHCGRHVGASVFFQNVGECEWCHFIGDDEDVLVEILDDDVPEQEG